jgi:hypothetical protein
VLESADKEMLENLQRETFDFFIDQVSEETGLTVDSTEPKAPSSITAVGMALTSYIVAVERKFLPRSEAIRRTLKVLRFFSTSTQNASPAATGYKGFYYHFLDMKTGLRTWESELSTIDTAFFIAGCLTVAQYFSGSSPEEIEIRSLADLLYRRVDWKWALNGGTSLTHGWKPESGFIPCRWDNNLSEAILLYVLAMGSPTFPISPKGYLDWTTTFEVKTFYDIKYIFAGPLFIHQLPHMWLDFKGIQDDASRKVGFDYFENSRRATLIQQKYAISNPLEFDHYGSNCWGFTASDGPGNVIIKVGHRPPRTFYDYIARGAPGGPDDGTVSPWAVVAALPFAPEIVIDTIRHAIERLEVKNRRLYGFDASFNFSYPTNGTNSRGWVSPWRFGLNQGPIVVMIENYFSQLVWKTFADCPYVIKGLKLANFKGGWLDNL